MQFSAWTVRRNRRWKWEEEREFYQIEELSAIYLNAQLFQQSEPYVH